MTSTTMSATMLEPSSSARNGSRLSSGRVNPRGSSRLSRSAVSITSCHGRHFLMRGCARYAASLSIDLKIGVRWIGTEWQYAR